MIVIFFFFKRGWKRRLWSDSVWDFMLKSLQSLRICFLFCFLLLVFFLLMLLYYIAWLFVFFPDCISCAYVKKRNKIIDCLRERGVKKLTGWPSTLQGQKRPVFNQTNIGTVSRGSLEETAEQSADGSSRVLWCHLEWKLETVWIFFEVVHCVCCCHCQSGCLYHLIGLVVKASASRAENPGFKSCLHRDFFEVESYQWLKN